MAQEIAVSTAKLKQFKQLVNSNYLNATRLQARLQNIIGSNELQDDDDDKSFERDILAEMSPDEVDSLQSHLNAARLIRDKLNWTHISSSLMHELDEKISFHFINTVKKLNISTIELSEAMEQKLNKKMPKQEVHYIRQLIQRAIQNTMGVSSDANTLKKQNDAPRETDLNGLNGNVLVDIFNVYRLYKFCNFHFESYTKEQFMKAIRSNAFIKQDKDEMANIFQAKYDNHMPFVLYPSWLIADDQFIIFNYFFASSYFANKLRTNPARNQTKFSVYIIPKKIVSIYDENMVFSGSIALDVSLFLTQHGFQTFSRTAIKESDAQDPNKLFQIIEYQLNGPGTEYLQQDVLLIIDRRQTQNILYVLNGSVHHDKLIKLQQNHLLGMEFDILRSEGGNSVVQCYFSKGIGEKIRFYPEYLTFFMCRLFKRNISLSDFEYVQSVYASSYRHGFGVDLEDPNLNTYHKMILNSLHISVNYNRDYVASELAQDAGDAEDTKEDDDASSIENEWAQQCNAEDMKPSSVCPYIEFIVEELRTFSQVVKHEVDSGKFNELLLTLALDHLVCIHSFCLNKQQREQIKSFVQQQMNGPCKHGKDCVVLQQYSNRQREIEKGNDKRGAIQRGDIQMNMIVDCLSTLHCYLEHEVFAYRDNVGGENNKFGTVVVKKTHDKYSQIDFAVSIHEWLDFGESPTFESFRDEIINSSAASSINESLYNYYKSECVVLVLVYKNAFGLLELMSIKLYTDTSELCKAFRMAFWKRKGKKEKKEFYWWALTLFKTMLYHSKPLNTISSKSTKPKTLYHGLNGVFILDDSCPFYNGPISTTSDVTVAHRFSNGCGLRWNIVISYSNPFRYLYGLEVHRISCFREENEVLVCNSPLPISTTKNYEDDEEMKMNLFMKQIKMYKRKEINASIFYNQIGFKFQNMWIQSIKTHPLLYQPLDIDNNERVIHRLRTVFNVAELDAPYTVLITKFEQNKALKRFATAFKLNVDEKHIDYFKQCKYRFVFDNAETKTINYNESIQFAANTRATVLVSNEAVFQSKTEFELQRISIAANQNETASGLFYFDEEKQCITLDEHEIPSTKKDILESILSAKYQIKYSNLLNTKSAAQYGQEYQCASLAAFAIPIEIPAHQIHLMIAPLVDKTAPKNVQGKWFKYQSTLDDNGILYGLATNFHQNKYSNPAEQQKVKIVLSNAQGKDSEREAYCLVGRKAVNFTVRGNGKSDPPFFYINIGQYGLKPNRYTLRNADKDSGYLTNWLLLASTDGIEWCTLKEHINAVSLKKEGPFEAAVWDINADAYFSYFKILMSGTNHAGEWQFGCCGFELYGHLIDGFEYVYDSMTLLKSYLPTRMQIDSHIPTQINREVIVSKFDSNGSVSIHSKSEIIIQKDGTINANDCYFNANDCVGGGTISLISDAPITNYGDITSTG
eukprot:814677_1